MRGCVRGVCEGGVIGLSEECVRGVCERGVCEGSVRSV